MTAAASRAGLPRTGVAWVTWWQHRRALAWLLLTAAVLIIDRPLLAG